MQAPHEQATLNHICGDRAIGHLTDEARQLLAHLGGDRRIDCRLLGQEFRSVRLACIVSRLGPVEVSECLAHSRDEALRLILAHVNLHCAPCNEHQSDATWGADGVGVGLKAGHDISSDQVALNGDPSGDSSGAKVARNETKVATHDGHIWPAPRDRMTEADAIHARMTDDLVAAAAQKIPATGVFSYLQQQGWTNSQIVDHSRTAIDLAVSAKRGAAA